MSTRSATQKAAIYDFIVDATKYNNVMKKRWDNEYGNPHDTYTDPQPGNTFFSSRDSIKSTTNISKPDQPWCPPLF